MKTYEYISSKSIVLSRVTPIFLMQHHQKIIRYLPIVTLKLLYIVQPQNTSNEIFKLELRFQLDGIIALTQYTCFIGDWVYNSLIWFDFQYLDFILIILMPRKFKFQEIFFLFTSIQKKNIKSKNISCLRKTVVIATNAFDWSLWKTND